MNAFILHIWDNYGVSAVVIEMLRAGQSSDAVYDRFLDHERLIQAAAHYVSNIKGESKKEHYNRMTERKYRLLDLAENL